MARRASQGYCPQPVIIARVHEEDASSHISGGDGAGGAVGRVVRAGGAALSQAWEGAAAGGSRAHAADLLFAAVVQPVGPGGRRCAVRLGGEAAVWGEWC